MQFNNIKGRTVVTRDTEVVAVEMGDESNPENTTPSTIYLSSGNVIPVTQETAESVASEIDSAVRDALGG